MITTPRIRPNSSAEQPVNRREAHGTPHEMRDDAAGERAEQQHDQEHDRAADPFAHCRLGERAAEPGIHEIGEMPGEPEADQPGDERDGLADEAAEIADRARDEQDDGEDVVGAVH